MAQSTSKDSSSSSSKFGLYSTLGIAALAIGGTIAAIPFLTPAMRKHALPYVPATPKQISNVFTALRAYRPDSNPNKTKLIDLGSGDGRIVFEAAKMGYQAIGVELNAVLCFYSKYKSIVDPELRNSIWRPKFKRADLWKVDMGEYDCIVVFGVQEMMKDLGTKLKVEMKPDALIVSCRNPIPSFKSVYMIDDELDSVWVYDKKSLYVEVKTNGTVKKPKPKRTDDDDDDDD